MTPIRMKTTQYGLSKRAGGWDPDGDSGTDSLLGNRGNKLNTASCALTSSAEAALSNAIGGVRQYPPGRLAPGTLLRISWPGTPLVRYVTFDDRAPESDARLDIFNPWAFDSRIPDFGLVEVEFAP